MKIPKIIHYCWFGGKEKPDLIKKCIKTWSILEEKGYKIIEWNENNFRINESLYAKKAYEEKRWAFVSDYVRLKVLYDYGGIYLDTDMEVLKDFDEFLDDEMFMGFMVNCVLATSIIGSKPKHNNIKELLDIYENLDLRIEPNNDLITKFILDKYKSFELNNEYQNLNDLIIYPKEYFNNPTYNKNINYSIHRYTGTWREDKSDNRSMKGIIINKILGDVLFYKIVSYKVNKKSPFYKVYLEKKRSK
ncbi:glycosyltransferase family 32 protein [uncultured Clostridium sp.]|uniref:glycosyltransferase family 32 protein n=1 Tax=uncultured Clostridium sp. TaxID=59620 RepID=UPI001A1DBE5A|nr:glycosyltransferase [uncultured Clostridium sp.]HAT4227606.1 mannosyltransferase [Clostridium perfringens]HBI7034456.1 mannosyltransferase [Clostridium perfringens]HBI7048256.1 mannosyltransferase [Clostridium perfringens]HBI7053393.1 mannosyltransferase [Clostridium perfringens]HBI7344480.1 mannosyltransferase [Clostridium perfringens]